MADLLIDRDITVTVAVKIPRDVWDRWEARHRHFGEAIHNLREVMVAGMSERSIRDWGEIPAEIEDPFWKGV